LKSEIFSFTSFIFQISKIQFLKHKSHQKENQRRSFSKMAQLFLQVKSGNIEEIKLADIGFAFLT